ncbi:hypothetical protein NGA_2091900, partial [Nannochloropsis gaditana CCMP526]|uniref:uncharacterized protein n=1 Tax=Nannochloropsis gaditana (strain CCMP526) TaxID=1093141 RepID=UPI00029F716F
CERSHPPRNPRLAGSEPRWHRRGGWPGNGFENGGHDTGRTLRRHKPGRPTGRWSAR